MRNVVFKFFEQKINILKLKILYRSVVYVVYLLYGFIIYKVTSQTPYISHQALIRLHCITNGRSGDQLTKIVSFFSRKNRTIDLFNGKSFLLGELSNLERKNINMSLKKDGFYIFDKLISSDLCDRLIEIAKKSPCTLKDLKTGVEHTKSSSYFYDSTHPLASIYDLNTEYLLKFTEIQNILSDEHLLQISQDYLNTTPILDIVHMWWSTSVNRYSSADGAQMFHFDMDRIKWLKIFIYLSDVTESTGPHVYVKGSHLSNKRSHPLLQKGYERLSDIEVYQVFEPVREIKEILGQKGTIFLADTRAFHKGKLPIEKERLILQLEFTNSLFGGVYKRHKQILEAKSNFNKMKNLFPKVYQVFDFANSTSKCNRLIK